jgi:hypothetical protein
MTRRRQPTVEDGAALYREQQEQRRQARAAATESAPHGDPTPGVDDRPTRYMARHDRSAFMNHLRASGGMVEEEIT